MAVVLEEKVGQVAGLVVGLVEDLVDLEDFLEVVLQEEEDHLKVDLLPVAVVHLHLLMRHESLGGYYLKIHHY